MHVRSQVWSHVLAHTRSGGRITPSMVQEALGVEPGTSEARTVRATLAAMEDHGWVVALDEGYVAATPPVVQS